MDDTGSGSAGSLVRPGSVTRHGCPKAEPQQTGKTESQEQETEKLSRGAGGNQRTVGVATEGLNILASESVSLPG